VGEVAGTFLDPLFELDAGCLHFLEVILDLGIAFEILSSMMLNASASFPSSSSPYLGTRRE